MWRGVPGNARKRGVLEPKGGNSESLRAGLGVEKGKDKRGQGHMRRRWETSSVKKMRKHRRTTRKGEVPASSTLLAAWKEGKRQENKSRRCGGVRGERGPKGSAGCEERNTHYEKDWGEVGECLKSPRRRKLREKRG